jgi:hypothetical protein
MEPPGDDDDAGEQDGREPARGECPEPGGPLIHD